MLFSDKEQFDNNLIATRNKWLIDDLQNFIALYQTDIYAKLSCANQKIVYQK